MQTCLQTGDPLACSQIVRNPNERWLNGPTQATGGYIVQTAVNIGQSLVRGIDAQTNYRLPLDRWRCVVQPERRVPAEHKTTRLRYRLYDCGPLRLHLSDRRWWRHHRSRTDHAVRSPAVCSTGAASPGQPASTTTTRIRRCCELAGPTQLAESSGHYWICRCGLNGMELVLNIADRAAVDPQQLLSSSIRG